mgnify:CR=1 FL=1
MSGSGDERPNLDRDETRLVARLRSEWAPAPLTAHQRAALDARLQERLESARRRVGFWPALGAGLAAASVAALLVLRIGAGTGGAPPSLIAGASSDRERAAWAADLLYASPADDEASDLDEDALPAEYAAIAGLFLDL